MDAGQIMMQTPGIAPTISAPASSETATAPAGEQSGSTFAGMLRGMSSLAAAPAAVAMETTAMGMTAAVDPGREPTDSKPAIANADITATLLAMVETRDQMFTTVGAVSVDEPDKPVELAQPATPMPQDVELLANGPQIALSTGGNGRMPESGQKIEHRDKPEKTVESAQPAALIPQDVALLANGAQIVLSTGGNGRMPESGQKIEHRDKPEKTVESAQPAALIPQDVALLANGAQIVLSTGGNGGRPESGQKIELQDKPEIPVASVQPDALIPQDVALLAAERQIIQSAGDNGSMPESDQKVEPQSGDRGLLQGSIGIAGEVAMPAKQGQPVEFSQSAMNSQKTVSMLSGETAAGKIAATDFPKVVTKEGGRDMLEKSIPVDSSLAGAKMETAVRSAKEASVVQRPVETKSTVLTAATAVNGMAVNEIPAVQTGRSQEVHPDQADANIWTSAEITPEQMDIPSDVQMVKASAMVQHPNPATVVMEAVGRKSENQEDGTPVHLDTATIKKNMESVSADSTKVSSSSAPEKELFNEGGKDTSDHGMNNQLHQPAVHQQVKADMGTSLGSTPGAGQKDALHSDMSENVFRQVKDVLVNREVKAGNEQITMRLTPEHLGELTLNLKMENQQLKVEIVAANRGVRDALMQQAENLKESLSRQNITMESFDVVTSGGQRGFEQNDRGWKQLAQQQFMAGTSSGGYRYRAPEVEEAVVPRYGMQKQYAMVDVHY